MGRAFKYNHRGIFTEQFFNQLFEKMTETIIKAISLIYSLKIHVLPGIRINIAENTMSDSLIVHICDESELNVHEIMLNE